LLFGVAIEGECVGSKEKAAFLNQAR